MEVTSTWLSARRIQIALHLVASLKLFAYLFPPQASVYDYSTYDFVIVGGGTAGCVLANRLTEDKNMNVLLIEAGGDPSLEILAYSSLQRTPGSTGIILRRPQSTHSAISNEFTIILAEKYKAEVVIHYMFYGRGSSYDYQIWAAISNDNSWNWEGVLPYFLKSEKLDDIATFNSPYKDHHGTDGYLGVIRESSKEFAQYLDAFRKNGNSVVFDINGNQTKEYTNQIFTISGGARQTTAYVYLTPIRSRSNLHVMKNTLVTKILFDNRNNAIGVKALTGDNNTFVIKASREVIVSAGALKSTQLLMLSGIGTEEHLKILNINVRSNLAVDYNFQNHPLVMISIQTENQSTNPLTTDPHNFPVPTFTGYVSLNPMQMHPDYPSINFAVPNESPIPRQLCSFNTGFDEDICEHLNDAGKGRRTILSYINLMHPKSRGRVTSRSACPKQAPLIYDGLFADENDLEDLVSYVKDYTSVLNTSYFQSIRAELVDLTGSRCGGYKIWSREYWRCYISCMAASMHDYSGTCSRGVVVDSRLRVRGVRRLRVVDASVMPKIIGDNIFAAVVMIAEKAADMIKDDWSDNVSPTDYRFRI